MDTSASVLGKRGRSMVEIAALEQNQKQVEGKRSRGDAPAMTMEVDPAVAQARAQSWSPELKLKLEANPSAAVEGADGAISAWVADERNCILGKELSQEEEETHAELVKAGNARTGGPGEI